ncbi:MAG: hypothetical protein RRC34_15895 [Lentisphaeria bacterium]|nr:hypothetical protein [Lentisphaeria bacterium]
MCKPPGLYPQADLLAGGDVNRYRNQVLAVLFKRYHKQSRAAPDAYSDAPTSGGIIVTLIAMQ